MTAASPPPEVPSPCERQKIVDTTTRLHMKADLHDWTSVRSCLADDLTVHNPAILSQEPREISADEFVAWWKQYLTRFATTQHLLTSHLVDLHDDGSARCETYLYAQHYLSEDRGTNFWTFGGHCEFILRQTGGEWYISEIVVTEFWTDGNERLRDLAIEATTDSPREQQTE